MEPASTSTSSEKTTSIAGIVLTVPLVLAAVAGWWWVVGVYLVAFALACGVAWLLYVWQNVVKAPKGKRDWEMLFLPVTGLFVLIGGLAYILLLRAGCGVLGPLCFGP